MACPSHLEMLDCAQPACACGLRVPQEKWPLRTHGVKFTFRDALSVQIDRLPVFYKQRDALFFPTWAYVRPPPTWDVFRCPSWRPPSGLVSACIRPFVPLCSGRAGIETLRALQPPSGHQALELMPSPAEGHLHVTCCRSTDSPAAFSRLTGLQWLPESQTRATNCSVPKHAWPDGAVFAVAALNLFAMAIAGDLRLAAQN